MPRAVIEPFRINSVEPIRLTSRAREVRGVRITRQSRYLRHFTAELAWA